MATDLSFEQQWNGAFEDAEMAPPEHVWVGIDRHLANEQLAEYKSEAKTYRWVAAACLLLLSVSGIYYFSGQSELGEPIAIEQTPNTESELNNTPAQKSINDELANKEPVTTSETEQNQTNNSDLYESNSVKAESVREPQNLATRNKTLKQDELILLATPDASKTPKSEIKAQGRHLLAMTEIAELSNKRPENQSVVSPWQADHLYGVPDYSAMDLKKANDYELFAGVNFGAGGFDPGFGTQSDFGSRPLDAEGVGFANLQSVNQIAADAQPSTGSAFSAGVDVGKRFSERFVFSGGVRFDAFSTSAGSATVVLDASNNSNYALLNDETENIALDESLRSGDLVEAGMTSLNNEFRYVSVPLKAGYILLDKKFNITVNSGISTSFLVDSYIKPAGDVSLSNDFNTREQYSSVYFNFLSSISFGYQFLDHYLISVEPSYNQALSDFTSSQNASQGKPRNIGVSLGFKYNF